MKLATKLSIYVEAQFVNYLQFSEMTSEYLRLLSFSFYCYFFIVKLLLFVFRFSNIGKEIDRNCYYD